MRGPLPVVALILLVAQTQVISSSNCDRGDVRLVGGASQYEGRVEVCINNAWGTVCDDFWNGVDATVVCRQLGYATTGSGVALINAQFGQGTGQIVLDDVQCSGRESQLLDCTSAPILTVSSNCDHSDDAGVRCEAPCTADQLRLVGANIPNEGRVEICMNNEWGTVCDDFWSSTDAAVVCRQLGYSTQDAVAFSSAHFGVGSGKIYLNRVGCSGSENRLIDCSHSTSNNCGHSEDAGVRCQVNVIGSCTYGAVHLVGGSNQYEGRVEVCINDQWGTVCDDLWDTTDATVVCNQLGYATTGSGIAYSNAWFGAGTGPIFLDNVQCSSSSSQLLECSSSPILTHNCQHSDDAGVGCEVPCTTSELRLVGGNVPNEGRVEICKSNVWGTVCDDFWGSSDATVVCRQLGYLTRDAVAFSRAHFGAGTGTIYLNRVSCTGSENNLINCRHRSTHDCSHSEDAGVRCKVPCANGHLRLVGGNTVNEGRVEICNNNEWGTVCDDSWESSDATVVCRQLGYSTTDAVAFGNAHFGAGTGAIYLDDVDCTGSENYLIDCSRSSTVSCIHSEDAGVRCQGIIEATSTTVPPTSSVAIAIPTCLPISSQSAATNRLVAILHDYTNSQFTDAAKANFTAVTEQIINMFCSTYTHTCVDAALSMSGCVTIIQTADNQNGQLAVTFYVSFNGSLLDSDTAMTALRVGITNGDYEVAGFSGQVDVVSLDTYNESKVPTSEAIAGGNQIKVVLPATSAVLVVVVFLAVVLLFIIKARKAKKCNVVGACSERMEPVERSHEAGHEYEAIFLHSNPNFEPPNTQCPASTHIHQNKLRSR